ncbi:MAG: N-acetyl-gamma-glutamyl-phosphate reductase [Myxococcaceae bacterium]|jgi:N-acetyl-gamma-glutamyl-phosphate reductase common form|nr:N-acetyl-gamma-glutamyl-phosphate reductase [Myxococcaceae bacterium]MEA2747395.1 N-acetyl-gamma-glutamyl-phosphate reductase [Myxococcales bacterium]
MTKTIGLVGARGYVGRELTTLVEGHGDLDLRLAISQRDGKSPGDVAATQLDVYVLALPNGTSEPYVEAITKARPDAVIVDLSADHRGVEGWTYGQPERHRAALRETRRIANPGCYATAAQLALGPLVPLLEGPANVFGVSGYSGAGTTPSPKNDPEALRDNLMPYALAGHVHEREIATQLGCRVFFMPHVAPFFRGLTVTVSVALAHTATKGELEASYVAAYRGEPLVHFQQDVPLVRDIAEKHDTVIGGLTVSEDGRHAVVVATLDNLLAGAATQALRNVNLALGFPENQGVPGAQR